MADNENTDQDEKPEDSEPTQIPLPDFEDKKDFGWGEDTEELDDKT